MNAAHLQEIINNYIDKFEITNGCILAQKEYQMTGGMCYDVKSYTLFVHIVVYFGFLRSCRM